MDKVILIDQMCDLLAKAANVTYETASEEQKAAFSKEASQLLAVHKLGKNFDFDARSNTNTACEQGIALFCLKICLEKLSRIFPPSSRRISL